MKKTLFKALTICVAALLVVVISAEARGEKKDEEKKLSRAEKKRIEAFQDSVEWAVALNALDSRKFVLFPERMQLTRTSDWEDNFEEMTNFFYVNGDRAVVQFGDVLGPGKNGLGGITLDGHVGRTEMKIDKKGARHLTFYVNGFGINANVVITLEPKRNSARALIVNSYSGDRTFVYGKIKPYTDNLSLNIIEGAHFVEMPDKKVKGANYHLPNMR